MPPLLVFKGPFFPFLLALTLLFLGGSLPDLLRRRPTCKHRAKFISLAITQILVIAQTHMY